jgi:putative NADH-flavin reductase
VISILVCTARQAILANRILREASERGHTAMASARDPRRIDSRQNATTLALAVSDRARLHKLAAQAEILICALSPCGGDAAYSMTVLVRR